MQKYGIAFQVLVPALVKYRNTAKQIHGNTGILEYGKEGMQYICKSN